MNSEHFVFLFFTVLIFYCCSTENNKNGVQTTEYYPNGKKMIYTTIDKATGKKCSQFFYLNGRTIKEYCTVNDTIQGLFKSYFENGNLQETSFYKNGKYQGERKLYHPNGMIESTGFYKEGKTDGEFRIYRNTGKIKAINYHVDGFIHYKKIFQYDSSENLLSAPESYAPLIEISDDTIKYGDALEVSFSLPLPEDKFRLDSFSVVFDFMSVQDVENGGFGMPLYSLSMQSGKAKKEYFIFGEGEQMLFGFISNIEKGDTIKSEIFEKKFYVKGDEIE